MVEIDASIKSFYKILKNGEDVRKPLEKVCKVVGKYVKLDEDTRDVLNKLLGIVKINENPGTWKPRVVHIIKSKDPIMRKLFNDIMKQEV